MSKNDTTLIELIFFTITVVAVSGTLYYASTIQHFVVNVWTGIALCIFCLIDLVAILITICEWMIFFERRKS